MRPSEKDERYPYTYACDWLRMMGRASSRSDAASLYSGYDEACSYADQYCLYWNTIQDAEEMLENAKSNLRSS